MKFSAVLRGLLIGLAFAAPAVAQDGQPIMFTNVNVFDGSLACLFDFRAVTTSGRSIAITGVNACEATSVTFE